MEGNLPASGPDQTSDDQVDVIEQRWRAIRPDLDPSPVLIVGRISRLAAAVDVTLRPLFAEAGIANGDFDLLAALRRQDPPHELSAGDLADAMLVTTGATTKRIDRLEAQGLVRRRRSTTDGRCRIIGLTSKGIALVNRLMPLHLDNEARLLERLTDNDRHHLERLLKQLSASIDRSVPDLSSDHNT